MVFELEKVLALSARDYVESVDKRLNGYELKGVHSSSMTTFLASIPEGAEVVVNYNLRTCNCSRDKKEHEVDATHYGVALIPK